MTTQLDFLFASFLRDYLDTADSRAAGVPAEEDCALLGMDADSDEKDPRICIHVEETGSGRSRQLAVVAVARGTAPRATTAPWLAAVGERLADRTALHAFIGTLTTEQRTGWQLHHITRPMGAKIQRQEGGVIESGVGLVMHVMVEL